MASFLMQFYEGVPPPKLILVDREPAECALVAEALGEAAGRKVEIGVPQRGNRRRLLEQAVRNAGEELDRRLAESSSPDRKSVVKGKSVSVRVDLAGGDII